MDTVWVFGDQLNRRIGALADAEPADTTVLLVESARQIAAGRHRQRVHLVVTAMRRFAAELEEAGFTVDRRAAPTLADGLMAHRRQHRPGAVVATEPNSRAARALCTCLEVATTRSNQFLCHHDEFARWADGRERMRMEDFYRHRRARLGYLMDGEDPAEGRWNWDAENREPPPAEPDFPAPQPSVLDGLDEAVIADLPMICPAPIRRGCGRPAGAPRSRACATSSSTRWRASGPTRTRCWPWTGTWRTRCCRPT